jgi:hypothetical protein
LPGVASVTEMNWSDDMLFTAFWVSVLDLAEYEHWLVTEFLTKEGRIFIDVLVC